MAASRSSPHAHGPSEALDRPAVRRAFDRERRRLGARLRALREARRWSLEQAAEAIGIHAKHLQRLESGKGTEKVKLNVTLATLTAASVAYRVTVAALFEAAAAEAGSKNVETARRRTTSRR